MVTRKTTNPDMGKLTPHVSPADTLRYVLQLGRAARTAALDLCYAAASYILLVNHFTDAKAKGFMARSDAIDYLTKQLRTEAGIEGGMLDIYIRNASTLAGMIAGSPTLFGPVLKELAEAGSPKDMIPVLASWMEKNFSNRVLKGKLDSLSTLSEALGYSTGRKPAGGGALTAAKVPDRIENTMKQIEKIVSEGDKSGTKVTAATVAKAITAAMPTDQQLNLAKEAIARVFDLAALDVLEQYIKAQRQRAKQLSAKAEASVKSVKKSVAKVQAKGKKSTTVRTQA